MSSYAPPVNETYNIFFHDSGNGWSGNPETLFNSLDKDGLGYIVLTPYDRPSENEIGLEGVFLDKAIPRLFEKRISEQTYLSSDALFKFEDYEVAECFLAYLINEGYIEASPEVEEYASLCESMIDEPISTQDILDMLRPEE